MKLRWLPPGASWLAARSSNAAAPCMRVGRCGEAGASGLEATSVRCSGAFLAAISGANAVGSAAAVCTSPSSKTRVIVLRALTHAERSKEVIAARSKEVREEVLSFEELAGCRDLHCS